MKTISKIANLVITISIILASIVGVYAYVSTPKTPVTKTQQIAQQIQQIEEDSIRNSDPTTWKVCYVSNDYSKAWMNINGDIHIFVIYEAYDNVIVIEDFNGQLQYYTYWS